MGMEEATFLVHLVKKTVSLSGMEERLAYLLPLLGQQLKIPLCLYFVLDREEKRIVLQASNKGFPVEDQGRVGFSMGQGVVGDAAARREFITAFRNQPGVRETNAILDLLHPAWQTLAAWPATDENSLYGVILLMDHRERRFTPEELLGLELTGLLIGSGSHQALQEETRKETEAASPMEVKRSRTGPEEMVADSPRKALGHRNQDVDKARCIKNFAAVIAISRALLTTIKEEVLLDMMLQGLTQEEGLGFDRALLLRVDKEAEKLQGLKGTQRPSSEETVPLEKALFEPISQELDIKDWEIPLGRKGGLIARAVQEMRALQVKRGLEEMGEDASGAPTGWEASEFAVMPLVVKDRAIGAVVVDNQASGRPLEPEALQALEMLAGLAALALEKANLYSTVETNNRELLLIRERMLESDRLAALSSLASGMAHEIRNPLVSIGGFARRIDKLVEPNSPLRGYVEVIQEEVIRLEKLLREILDFTGENLSYYGDHDLAKIIEETLILVQRDLDAGNIKVVKEFVQLPRLHCDDRQMKQVFYNLFQNAIQAMSRGGILTIRTFPAERPDGLYAAAAISDTGGGIPMEVLHNVFNPFFSTKDSGTGLGMAIAQRIVSRHYGQISVDNKLGKGVTFSITLPVAKYCLI